MGGVSEAWFLYSEDGKPEFAVLYLFLHKSSLGALICHAGTKQQRREMKPVLVSFCVGVIKHRVRAAEGPEGLFGIEVSVHPWGRKLEAETTEEHRSLACSFWRAQGL